MPSMTSSPGYIKLMTGTLPEDSVASMTFAQAITQYLLSRALFSAVFIPIDEQEPDALGDAFRQCSQQMPILRGSVQQLSQLSSTAEDQHLVVCSSQIVVSQRAMLLLRNSKVSCDPLQFLREDLPDSCARVREGESQVLELSTEQLAELHNFPIMLFRPGPE